MSDSGLRKSENNLLLGEAPRRQRADMPARARRDTSRVGRSGNGLPPPLRGQSQDETQASPRPQGETGLASLAYGGGVSAPVCAQTAPLGSSGQRPAGLGRLPPSPEGGVHTHRSPGPAPPPLVPLAGQRLLNPLPHFLGPQEHHHLSDRGSLLQREKTLAMAYMACGSHSLGHPDTAARTRRRRACISLSLRARPGLLSPC